MPRAASYSPLGSEFDAFLFASIGEDASGLSLSVVSALARLDLDPWQEAATLATLPPDAAARKIAALFQAVPDELLSDPDRGALATRLIALLPRPGSSENRNSPSVVHSRLNLGTLLFAMMLVLLTAQFIIARHAPSTLSDASQTAPSLPGPP